MFKKFFKTVLFPILIIIFFITYVLMALHIFKENKQEELIDIETEELIKAVELIEENPLTEEEVKWIERYEEYPNATIVWKTLKDKGYNDFVTAGILGNMMVECGGNSLNLDSTIYSKDKFYYGICQWNKRYYPEVFDMDLEFQLNFLFTNIKYEIDRYGFYYKKDFNFEQFLEIDNEQTAALAFAKSYERCSSRSYGRREYCASLALEYFS